MELTPKDEIPMEEETVENGARPTPIPRRRTKCGSPRQVAIFNYIKQYPGCQISDILQGITAVGINTTIKGLRNVIDRMQVQMICSRSTERLLIERLEGDPLLYYKIIPYVPLNHRKDRVSEIKCKRRKSTS